MKVSILTIGNELMNGKTQDTNSSAIARLMTIKGWHVPVTMSVPDDEDAIRGALSYCMSLSDAVVVTGGLGPTADDITTAAIAGAFGLKLHTDESVLKNIKERFEKYHIPWTENNAKQAVFPEGAETIQNPIGSAWGYFLKKAGKVIAVVPGVPAEVQRMVPEGVVPVLQRELEATASHILSRTIKLSGITEARVDHALAGVSFEALGVEVGFYPDFPEIQVVLTARSATETEAKARLKSAEKEVSEILQHYIFAHDQDTLEGIIAGLLTDQKLTLAIAESCTGGLIADRLTDIPGSSAFFERGVIAYSNEAKTSLLGVSEDVLRDYGAVSERAAVLMAEGVRNLGGCDLGLATTGIAGPTGGKEEKPVGTVFIALADGRKTICRNYSFRWDRRRNKTITSQTALMMLKRYLEGERKDE